jgi:hypothetical protein
MGASFEKSWGGNIYSKRYASVYLCCQKLEPVFPGDDPQSKVLDLES